MPLLERGLVKQRAERLRQKGREVLAQHLEQQVGSIREVLMEQNGIGRTRQFTPVRVRDGADLAPGSLVDLRIDGHDGKILRGHGVLPDRSPKTKTDVGSGTKMELTHV
jgi:threonylcarbamoyladenosine tRNA methylthiotransferase MtaB